MAGRSYTMGEFRDIVQYLKENNAYGDIKGRKLWMTYASTSRTNRTWQSLKETFLKRIMPTIHDPYYKLTSEEIASFRMGYSISTAMKNKLDLRSNTKENNDNSHNKTSNMNNNHEDNSSAGEDISKQSLHSVDILNNGGYENVEDIIRDLESEGNGDNTKLVVSLKASSSEKGQELVSHKESLQGIPYDIDSGSISSDTDPSPSIIIPKINKPNKNVVKESNIKINKSVSTEQKSHVEKKIANVETVVNNIKNNKPVSTDKKAHIEKKIANVEAVVNNIKINKPVSTEKKTHLGKKLANVETVINTKTNISKDSVSLKEANSKQGKVKKNLINNDAKITKSNKHSSDISSNSSENETKLKDNIRLSLSKDSKISRSGRNKTVQDTDLLEKESTGQHSQNSTNLTGDSVIPNNQEALKSCFNKRNSQSTTPEPVKIKAAMKSDKNNRSKKRSLDSVDASDDLKNVKKKPKKKNEDENSNINNLDVIHQEVTNVEVHSSHIGSENKSEEKQVVNNDLKVNSNVKNETSQKELSVLHSPKESYNKIESVTQKEIETLESNPCLQSVSLFAEELVTYESSNNKNIQETETTKDNVVILHSHSEDESSPTDARIINAKKRKRELEKSLAKVFGFSSGGHSNILRLKRTSHHLSQHKARDVVVSDTNESTSDSDSDFVQLPRNDRHTRKYLKPDSARIMSLENEGGLFAAYKNKVYPIIEDGKMMKGFLTMKLPSDMPYNDNISSTFWKDKYVKEKKRTAELAKLLDDTTIPKMSKCCHAPMQTHKSKQIELPTEATVSNYRSCDEIEPVAQGDELVAHKANDTTKEKGKEEKTIKFKFVKNDQEVTLEGHWQSIQPILAEVMNMFQKDTKPNNKNDVKSIENGCQTVNDNVDTVSVNKNKAIEPSIEMAAPPPPEENKSGKCSPIILDDEEVRKRVDKIEEAIFKEIEEIDKSMTEEKTDKLDTSAKVEEEVKPRKIGRPKKKTTGAVTNKRDCDNEIIVNESKLRLVENTHVLTTKGITPKKESPKSARKTRNNVSLEDAANINTIDITQDTDSSKSVQAVIDNDSGPRYKFPSPERNVTRNNAKKIKNTNNKKEKSKFSASLPSKNRSKAKKYPMKIPQTSHPTEFSSDSMESMQDYRDSDSSPINIKQMKRRLSLPIHLSSRRKMSYLRPSMRHRNKSPFPNFLTGSSDSSCSKSLLKHLNSSSLNSEVYRSESYELLMQHSRNQHKNTLEKIDELDNGPVHQEIEMNLSPASQTMSQTPIITQSNNCDLNLSPASQMMAKPFFISERDKVNKSDDINIGNSSNVSLPPSPELSIVENISISKDLLQSITLNDVQFDDDLTDNNEQSMSREVNVFIPLMDQKCDKVISCDMEIRNPHDMLSSQNSELTAPNENNAYNMLISHNSELTAPDENMSITDVQISNKSTLPDSLISKINTVNIADTSSPETLNDVLRKMLLDSAKKFTNTAQDEISNNAESSNKVLRKKSTKRCSTPHKKRKSVKAKKLMVDTVIDECMEFCSRKGHSSCPPSIVCPVDDYMNLIDTSSDNETTLHNKNNSKGKRKRDIIKVKILKPKIKNASPRLNIPNPFKNRQPGTPKQTNSDINDSGSEIFSQISNESVDLIHNHSDTCLQGNCHDSVIYIDSDSNSAASLGTSPLRPAECTMGDEKITEFLNDCQKLSNDNVGNNTMANETATPNTDSPVVISTSHLSSPTSMNSIMTEDLSSEIITESPSTWYIYTDDENSNSNLPETRTVSNNKAAGVKHSDYIKQLFPVVCAVPDLSTITEASRDTQPDNDSKPAWTNVDADLTINNNLPK